MLKIITTLSFLLIGILAKGQEVENKKITSSLKIDEKKCIHIISFNRN